MSRVTLRDPQETAVEVELDGRVFTITVMTRTRQKLVDEAFAALNAAESSDGDAVATAIIGVISALVVPTDGQRKSAADVLLPMWQGDKLSISQLSQLLEDLQEAAESRPT